MSARVLLWVKRWINDRMVGVGVDTWPAVEHFDKLNTLLGIANVIVGGFLGVLGVVLTALGILLAFEQNKIAEVQHAVFLDQQERRVNLEFWAHLFSASTPGRGDVEFALRVRNQGRKTAQTWRWCLDVPFPLEAQVRRFDPNRPFDTNTILTRVLTGPLHSDLIRYCEWSSVPVLPGADQDVLLLTLSTTMERLGSRLLYWSLGTEDGRTSGTISLRAASSVEMPPY